MSAQVVDVWLEKSLLKLYVLTISSGLEPLLRVGQGKHHTASSKRQASAAVSTNPSTNHGEVKKVRQGVVTVVAYSRVGLEHQDVLVRDIQPKVRESKHYE